MGDLSGLLLPAISGASFPPSAPRPLLPATEGEKKSPTGYYTTTIPLTADLQPQNTNPSIHTPNQRNNPRYLKLTPTPSLDIINKQPGLCNNSKHSERDRFPHSLSLPPHTQPRPLAFARQTLESSLESRKLRTTEPLESQEPT